MPNPVEASPACIPLSGTTPGVDSLHSPPEAPAASPLLHFGSMPLNMSSPAPELPVLGADSHSGVRYPVQPTCFCRVFEVPIASGSTLSTFRSPVFSIHGSGGSCSCGITLMVRLYSRRVCSTAFLDVPGRVFETSASLNLDTGGWLALPDKDLFAVLSLLPFCKLTL